MENKIKILEQEIKKRQFTILQKLLLISIFCFFTVLFAMYSALLLGYDGFFIYPLIMPAKILDSIIPIVLFFINLFFLFSISLEEYNRRIILILIGYIPVYLFGELYFDSSIYTSLVLPYAFVILIALYRQRIIKTMLNILTFTIVTFIYQVLALDIKANIFNIDYNSLPTFQLLIASIDLIILYLTLYFLIGGELLETKLRANCKEMDRQLTTLSETSGHLELDEEDLEALNEFRTLEGWDLAKSVTIILFLQVFQFIVILALTYIGNVFIESLVILFSYIMAGVVIKKKSHFKYLICTSIAGILFYATSKIAPPIEISVFILVIIGMLIAYTMFLVAVHFEEYDKYRIFYNTHNDFDLKTCTVEMLEERCRLCGMSKEDTELCIKLFIDKITNKEASLICNIEEQSMRNKKRLLKRKLMSLK